jgi:hypothetical protein
MNHYLIFAIGVFIGTFLGLLIAGLLDAAHRTTLDQEAQEKAIDKWRTL